MSSWVILQCPELKCGFIQIVSLEYLGTTTGVNMGGQVWCPNHTAGATHAGAAVMRAVGVGQL